MKSSEMYRLLALLNRVFPTEVLYVIIITPHGCDRDGGGLPVKASDLLA